MLMRRKWIEILNKRIRGIFSFRSTAEPFSFSTKQFKETTEIRRSSTLLKIYFLLQNASASDDKRTEKKRFIFSFLSLKQKLDLLCHFRVCFLIYLQNVNANRSPLSHVFATSNRLNKATHDCNKNVIITVEKSPLS